MDKNKLSNKVIFDILLKKVFWIITISLAIVIFFNFIYQSLFNDYNLLKETGNGLIAFPFFLVVGFGYFTLILVASFFIWAFIINYVIIKGSLKRYILRSNMDYESKVETRKKVRNKIILMYIVLLPLLYLLYKIEVPYASIILTFEMPGAIMTIIYLYGIRIKK